VPDLVVTGGRLTDAADPCDVVVTDGRVEVVVPAGTADPAVDTVDATGCLVLPGLVEAHCHLDKTLFGRPWVSHLAGDTLAARIAHDRGRRAELGLPDPGAMQALVEAMAGFGTTTLRTHTDVDPDVGLRGVVAVGELADDMRGRVDIEQAAFPQHGLLSLPGTAALLDEAMDAGASVVGGLDPGAEGDAAGYLDVVLGIAVRHEAAVDLHLHTHGNEGRRELELLAEMTSVSGLQGRVVASHCYAFGDLDELEAGRLAERLAGAGIGVVTAAPYSFPVPPLRLLADTGVVTGIGHDGIRDLWGPYGTGDLLERARHIAYRSGFRRDEDIELVLRAATTGGRQLLTGDRRGVEPGAVADLVVVPATNAAEAVVLVPERRAVVKRGAVTRAAGPPSPPPGRPAR
jgi:cytosine/adenosine deaminase-related metal-dependent hydrolase